MGRRDDDVLAAVAGGRDTGSGYIRVDCPFCAERVFKTDTTQAFWLSSDTGWYGCWRCEVRGRLDGFEDVAAPSKVVVDAFPFPDGFRTLSDAQGLSWTPAVRYLRSRGISRDVATEVGIGATVGDCWPPKYAWRIIVPVIVDGRDRGWVGRSYSGDPDRYRYPPGMPRGDVMFGEDAVFRDTAEPLLVCEGVFDALAYWPDAVAVLGKPTERQVATLRKASRPLVFAFDRDMRRTSWALAAKLRLHGCQTAWIDFSRDAKDPSALGREGIRDALSQVFRSELDRWR